MKNDLEITAIRALDAWDTTVLPKANDGRMQECMEDLRLAVAELRQPTEVWSTDAPPKRGAYRVRRVGKASTNYGYSYWTGEGWGPICAKRQWAQETKGIGRRTPSRYSMQWLKKTAHSIKGVA